MPSGRYEPRMVRANPDLYVIVWVPEDGPPIQDGVQMTEQELRAVLKMKWSRTENEIDQIIADAQENFVA